MRFDELKNDLVATVAHEFRTPLTSLRMAIHLCAEEAVGPAHGEAGRPARSRRARTASGCRAIVDDLLDLSRIQAGPDGARACERVDAGRACCDDRRWTRSGQPPGSGASRSRSEVAAARPAVEADPERAAARARPTCSPTPSATRPRGGEVTVRAAPSGRAASASRSRDTGEGIPPEHQDAHLREVLPRAGRARRAASGSASTSPGRSSRPTAASIGVESDAGAGQHLLVHAAEAQAERAAASGH